MPSFSEICNEDIPVTQPSSAPSLAEKNDVHNLAAVVVDEPEDNLPRYFLGADPAMWPEIIIDSVRVILVENGPVSPDLEFEYPRDDHGRRFPPKCVKRKLKNGEVVVRSWLIYSKSVDAVFCFCCKLFDNTSVKMNLTTTGSKDWKNMHAILDQHERNPRHISALTAWIELQTRLQEDCTIDANLQKIVQAETHRWEAVLERLLSIIIFLSEQGLALRGDSDVLYQRNNGNFLKTVEFLAKFDNVMAEHVRKITDNETHIHYMSHEIQNELITLLANSMHDYIQGAP